MMFCTPHRVTFLSSQGMWYLWKPIEFWEVWRGGFSQQPELHPTSPHHHESAVPLF